ncbi:MAG: hypothetical protein OEZ43_10100 [Gammaproteobacteria bacterium]|nr:hypothetical protein [Gammaproteobacteria bacterium]
MGRPGHANEEGYEESYSFEDSYFEPTSGQLGEDWDTLMEEYFDDYEDFKDVNFPDSDDDL